MTIIRGGSTESSSSCCSVNRPFLINVNPSIELLHTFEITIGVQGKDDVKTGTFSKIGCTHLYLSEDDIKTSVSTPKAIYVPLSGNDSNFLNGEIRNVKRQNSLVRLLRRKRKDEKQIQSSHSIEIGDDESLTTLDTSLSLSKIGQVDDLSEIQSVRKSRNQINLSREAYVTVLVESYEQKPFFEVEMVLDRVSDLFSCLPSVVCSWDRNYPRRSIDSDI